MNFHRTAEIHLCNRNDQVVVSKGVSFFRNLAQLVHNPSADGSIVVVLFNLEQLSYLIQGGATVDGIAAVLVFLNPALQYPLCRRIHPPQLPCATYDIAASATTWKS